MQDDTNKQYYFSLGEAEFGDKACLLKAWFFEDKTYMVSYPNNDCSATP